MKNVWYNIKNVVFYTINDLIGSTRRFLLRRQNRFRRYQVHL